MKISIESSLIIIIIVSQVSHEDVDRYTKAILPTKQSLNEKMDEFSFMPRISFADTDSIQVHKNGYESKLLP